MAADRITDSTADLFDVDASCRVAGRVWQSDGTKIQGVASAPLAVRKNSGSNVGIEPRLNLREGAGVSLAVTDDGGNAEVAILITSVPDGGYF